MYTKNSLIFALVGIVLHLAWIYSPPFVKIISQYIHIKLLLYFNCRELPEQAHNLVNEMRGDLEIDIDKDWKLLTLFIGANDLCKHCLHEYEVHTQKPGNKHNHPSQ